MNRKIIINMTGKIIITLAALLVLPLLVSVIYLEWDSALAFGITIAGCCAVGFLLTVIFKANRTNERLIFTREGLMIVGLAWLLVSLLGAVPFVICGDIKSYVDAFFETASGFSTTGATILSGEQIEAMSHGMLFWRSFTHWIGGMGVLVFIMALLPSDSESGRQMHIMRAEMPGPIVGKLVPKVKDTAKVLYILYIGMTVLETVLLLFGGMNLFESLIHSLGTAGTGGFGSRADSIGGYNSYIQWVIAAFMILFSVNFNLYYLAVKGKIKEALSSREMWIFFGILAVATGVLVYNILPERSGFGEAVRESVFQAASFASTTGYATADANAYPTMAKIVLIALMFIGGCAGSTAGGLKLSRVLLMIKSCGRYLRINSSPRSVRVVRLEGKKVDDDTVSGVGTYFMLYFIILAACVLLLSFEPFDFEMIFTSVLSCLNNIGPAFTSKLGYSPSFGDYSAFSKIVLTLAMLLGRLELYPILFVFSPDQWKKN